MTTRSISPHWKASPGERQEGEGSLFLFVTLHCTPAVAGEPLLCLGRYLHGVSRCWRRVASHLRLGSGQLCKETEVSLLMAGEGPLTSEWCRGSKPPR